LAGLATTRPLMQRDGMGLQMQNGVFEIAPLIA
jgi:hypothetical protein